MTPGAKKETKQMSRYPRTKDGMAKRRNNADIGHGKHRPGKQFNPNINPAHLQSALLVGGHEVFLQAEGLTHQAFDPIAVNSMFETTFGNDKRHLHRGFAFGYKTIIALEGERTARATFLKDFLDCRGGFDAFRPIKAEISDGGWHTL